MGKKLHPLHTVQMIVDYVTGSNEYFDESRGTGRSTALALAYLAEAIHKPRQSIAVRDHSDNREANRHLARLCVAMADQLGLRHIRRSSDTGIIFDNTPIPAPASAPTPPSWSISPPPASTPPTAPRW